MNKITTCLEPLHGRGEQCGDMIRGKDDDDIVAKVQKHLRMYTWNEDQPRRDASDGQAWHPRAVTQAA